MVVVVHRKKVWAGRGGEAGDHLAVQHLGRLLVLARPRELSVRVALASRLVAKAGEHDQDGRVRLGGEAPARRVLLGDPA